MFYTDEEHGFDIYGKEMCLTFKKRCLSGCEKNPRRGSAKLSGRDEG